MSTLTTSRFRHVVIISALLATTSVALSLSTNLTGEAGGAVILREKTAMQANGQRYRFASRGHIPSGNVPPGIAFGRGTNTNFPVPCDTYILSGGITFKPSSSSFRTEVEVELYRSSGIATIFFRSYALSDKLSVFYEGEQLPALPTGDRKGFSQKVPFSGGSKKLTISVESTDIGSAWDAYVYCK